MSDTAPLQLACRFSRLWVEGCPSLFEVHLTSVAGGPVQEVELEFCCAGLKEGLAEFRLQGPLLAGESMEVEISAEPMRKGTPPMTVHVQASTARGRFSAQGSIRPGGQGGICILERPENLQSLTVQIQEKAFFGSVFAEGGIDFGKITSLNDYLQLHLPAPMEPVALSWDGFPVARNLQPGTVFAQRFKLVEPLGLGGMGVVWLAEDLKLRSRLVALKFLPETVCHDPDAIDDLKHELLLSQELTHENIVRIHDLIEAEGTAAISMEYIRGKTLSSLRREQPSRVFSTDQLLPWMGQLCAALHYAHGKGIIHHDVKPKNIMINDQGVLKVCDFGLAGSMAESRSQHSRPGHTSGTTPYMSPQHLLLGSRTVADDVYALGATLYELLTSKQPFYAGSIETQIQTMEPRPIAERRAVLRIKADAEVPPHWEAAILDCLSKVAEKRPVSALELWQRLAEAKTVVTKKTVEVPVLANPLDAGAIGKPHQVTLPGGVKLALCWCPAGSFMMGSPETEADRYDNEAQVQVTLTQPFWLGTTPTTQAQWVALMGSNPSYFKGDDLPVESVSAKQADAFITKLNEKVPLKGWKWVLPTEAQWEYACRAGTTTPFSFGSELNGKEANCDGNCPCGTETKGPYLNKTTMVGSYPANGWGLHDMHGNVCEWCRDLWDSATPLPGGTNPLGTTGSDRVGRGGSWNYVARYCRAASRNWNNPGFRYHDLGCRVAAVPAGAE